MNNFLQNAIPGELRSRSRVWRWSLPVLLLLLLLFLSTLLWLPWQAQRMEASERQEQLIADTLWLEQAMRFQLSRNEESLRLVGTEITAGQLAGKKWHDRLDALLRNSRELERIVWLDAAGKQVESTDAMPVTLADYSMPSRLTAQRARDTKTPRYSQPARSLPLKSGSQLSFFTRCAFIEKKKKSSNATVVIFFFIGVILEQQLLFHFLYTS